MWVEKKGWHEAKIAEAIGQILRGFLAPGKALSFQVVGKAPKKMPSHHRWAGHFVEGGQCRDCKWSGRLLFSDYLTRALI